MNELTILKEFLVNGLKTLYQTESKLAGSVAKIIRYTEPRPLKAELLVYLESVGKNMKAIEEIFCFLEEGVVQRETPRRAESFNSLFFIHRTCWTEPPMGNFMNCLQRIIQSKMFLYENAYCISLKLNQPRIASILNNILEFEKDTQVILTEVVENTPVDLAAE